ncbi:MAG: hypothetical protein HY550_08895 [Elusimicrobia bacterium]|nr:hypothetical protein [Elusimicrobiota bacterium]
MKKAMFALVLVSLSSSAFAADFSELAALKAPDLAVKTDAPAVPVPAAPVKETAEVPQDLVYKFTRVSNDLRRLEADTTWLRNDINRLESDARRIEQGSSNVFFSNDLRRMSMDMSRRAGDIQRLAMDLKSLLNSAQKDSRLNQLARDMEWNARDLDNRFQFDILNAAQNLEWTVRRIDPKKIGYDAQWAASDLTRSCRDIQWKTRDLRWDAQELVRRTQP